MTAGALALSVVSSNEPQPVAQQALMSGDADQAITTTNRQRLAWLGEVNRYRSEQTRLQQRIAAVDAKTYQAADTLAKSATALQQPLLHTFDRSKATKPSRTAWP